MTGDTPPAAPEPEAFTAEALLDAYPILNAEERLEGFVLLSANEAADCFLTLSTRDQADLLQDLGPERSRPWMRLLAPDDAADLLQALPGEDRYLFLALLDPATRGEVTALLAYAEDAAGGVMNPRYMRLRPDISVEVAIRYLRRQAIRGIEVIDYAYVLDPEMHLLGVVPFRELFAAGPEKQVREIMHTDLVTVAEDADQEAVAHLLVDDGLLAIPVVDADGRMKGVVTADDVVGVVQEEATEDIQKIGGSEALDEPYLQIGFSDMVRKRGRWLAVLFVGEMLTATAMGFFEKEIARAVILALFVPLIISSGGNSGSQAATLVIRAMALSEVRLRDWWRVARRELMTGLVLGLLLGLIGLVRILVWQAVGDVYGEHYMLVALTVAGSLIGVVMFGTLAGSMLPFVLRRFGADPASASEPYGSTTSLT
ncbi:MAG: magnesium transporter [Gemmatimonadales bacterium]